MRENNIVHHTYQPKENRAFRVVIKNLHFSTNIEEIKDELSKQGHKVRNIHNGKSRVTKEPLNLFFVDLEPSDNNKEIYKVRGIQNRVVQIEPPKKVKGLPQCMRCQQYGHTKTYCNRPFVCVKCGGAHSTQNCKKSNNTPAKCALCDGPHPANYKGCEFYHAILTRANNQNNRLNVQQPIMTATTTNNHYSEPRNQTTEQQQKPSYADTLKGINKGRRCDNDSTILTSFLTEFKNMFQQLVQQNNMILNMLSTLITKIR